MKPPRLEVIVELSKEVERVQSTVNSIECITTLILNDLYPNHLLYDSNVHDHNTSNNNTGVNK